MTMTDDALTQRLATVTMTDSTKPMSEPESSINEPAALDNRIVCENPRPQICTRHLEPTCAFFADGSNREYGNPCEACADPKVISVARVFCE